MTSRQRMFILEISFCSFLDDQHPQHHLLRGTYCWCAQTDIGLRYCVWRHKQASVTPQSQWVYWAYLFIGETLLPAAWVAPGYLYPHKRPTLRGWQPRGGCILESHFCQPSTSYITLQLPRLRALWRGQERTMSKCWGEGSCGFSLGSVPREPCTPINVAPGTVSSHGYWSQTLFSKTSIMFYNKKRQYHNTMSNRLFVTGQIPGRHSLERKYLFYVTASEILVYNWQAP